MGSDEFIAKPAGEGLWFTDEEDKKLTCYPDLERVFYTYCEPRFDAIQFSSSHIRKPFNDDNWDSWAYQWPMFVIYARDLDENDESF